MAITSPTDIANCAVWLNAQTIAGSDNDALSSWADSSGNANHFDGAGGNAALKLNIKNGHAVVRFDGIDDFLYKASLIIPQPLTIVMYAAHRSGAVAATEAFCSGATFIPGIFASDGSPDAYSFYAGTEIKSTEALTTGFRKIIAVFNGASSLIRVDGVETTGNVGTTGSVGIFVLGCASDSGATQLGDVDLGEFAMYSAALAGGNFTDLEDYLDDHWAAAAAQVATPTIDPDGGAITASDEITLACATPGATIYYTIDGSTPDSSDIEYTAPFTLSATATVKRIAIKSGMDDSAVASADFTVTASAGGGSEALFLSRRRRR